MISSGFMIMATLYPVLVYIKALLSLDGREASRVKSLAQ
jgi:hypothetical protein